MPLSLSVIVPVYNERALVEASLRRLLVLEKSPLISRVQVIVVDDGSSDGTAEVLSRCAKSFAKNRGRFSWVFMRHEANAGKGAAFKTGLTQADGDVTIIHDADLEYFPEEIPDVLLPFVEAGADAVYGSRFLPRRFRSAKQYRHELLNRAVTLFANLATNINMTDSATCYKAVRTELLKSLPLYENDFRIEPELTMKLAKRGARLFEVPISYAGRSVQEGKKISWVDGLRAVAAYIRYGFSDDIFAGPSREANLFARLNRAPHYQQWMLDKVKPWIGEQVLELGAKTGHLTARLLPRGAYWVTENDPQYLASLRTLALNKPYMKVLACDPEKTRALPAAVRKLDSVLCMNVLAFVDEPAKALAELSSRLAPGGHLVLVMPKGSWLFGSLDEALGHRRRFSAAEMAALLEGAGLETVANFGFNRTGSLPWWLNSRVFRRRGFSLFQVKVADWLTALLKLLDPILPLPALTQVAVGRKAA